MKKNAKIFVAGHKGLLGSAVCKKLREFGYTNIITRTHTELDLCEQQAVFNFFEIEKPDYVVFAAAYVGGIGKNIKHPAPFLYDNVMMGFNIIEAARRNNVKKLINIASTCIYPQNCVQPIKEEYLLTGAFDTTHESYAYAKLAVLKLCEKYNVEYNTDFYTIVPNNIYGPNDNYGESCHVLPAMIRKFHESKINGKDEVILWGDGTVYRELIYSEDVAEAIIFMMEDISAKNLGNQPFVNVGYGLDYSIREIAEKVKSVVYADTLERSCSINWDTTKPNGVSRRVCDISKLQSLGYTPHTNLEEGILATYISYTKSDMGGGTIV